MSFFANRMGLFFVLSNLWSKNYNRMKEGILTNVDILMPVFQAGDRIFHKQWDEFLLENPRKSICTNTDLSSAPRAPPAFLLVCFVRFYSVPPTLSSQRMPLLRAPQSKLWEQAGESWCFCASQQWRRRETGVCPVRKMLLCASHSRRN